MPDYLPYSPPLLRPFVDFWNRTFADRRNFVPLSAEAFEQRVLARRNAVEAFDPAALILAVERDAASPEARRVVGAAHTGVWPELFARVVDPSWAGGDLGYLALLAVDPARRRRGIGSELWARAVSSLRACRKIVIDGQCLNPFYGNSEGPETPFWGTPEGISIPWTDLAAQRFFKRRGHVPRYRALHLQWTSGPSSAPPWRDPLPTGVALLTLDGRYVEPGKLLSDEPRCASRHPFTCIAAHNATGSVIGIVSFFPLVGLDAGRYAIYEWLVVPEMRRSGLGRNLLASALRCLRERGVTRCDALTISEVSSDAIALYRAAGFHEVDAWAIY